MARCLLIAAIVLVVSAATSGAEVSLQPVKDNTLFEESGNESNGKGIYLFTGSTAPRNSSAVRRALLAFDVTGNVPSGATITSASLTLNMSKTVAGSQDASLHRLVGDWGEGDSDASGDEGRGATAGDGDATWTHSFLSTTEWDMPGGDFVADPSATVSVSGGGKYTWESASLMADVQLWIDDPSMNFGWILIGNESQSRTAKRFDSREHSNTNNRPLLTIGFDLASVLGDFDGDGQLTVDDVDLLSSQVVSGGDPSFDLTNDGNVDGNDVEALLGLAGRINGDADFDGQVQFSDFVVLSDNFSLSDKKWSEGDFDSSGEVQFSDFVILSTNFGQGEAAAAVPEPAGGLLLSLALPLLGVRRRLLRIWA